MALVIACAPGSTQREEEPCEQAQVCWSWPANVVREQPAWLDREHTTSGWLEGERAWLLGNALFELGPTGWITAQAIPYLVDFQRGDGWSALHVRGGAGESDWIQYRRDGEEWGRVDAPDGLTDLRWTAMTHSQTHLYLRGENGVITRFDGERWERVTVNEAAPFSAALALAGDVLYDWHNGSADVFDDGAFTPLPATYGKLLWGDGGYVFFDGDRRTPLKLGPEGSEDLPTAPGTIDLLRARGEQIAIQVDGWDWGTPSVYRLIDGRWELAAVDHNLIALDTDGTLLVSQGPAASLVAPDGGVRVLGAGHEPIGPLVGESLDALWARSSQGGLLRLAGDHWKLVSGTESLRLSALWRSPSGTLFLATSSEVYRLSDRLEALPGPGLGATHGLVGRGDEEVYLSSIDEAEMLRVQRWDGSAWSELETLAALASGPESYRLEVRAIAPPRLVGADGFLTVRTIVDEPDNDPLRGQHARVSTGGTWTNFSDVGFFDYNRSGTLYAIQFGSAATPQALFLTTMYGDDFSEYVVVDPEHPREPLERGTFEHAFIGPIAGDDFEHMAGVVETDRVMRFLFRDGGSWQTRGRCALSFGGRGASWYGADAIGVASDDGVTICER